MSETNPESSALLKAWTEILDSDATLAEKLAAYATAARSIVPEFLAAYDRMVIRTAACGTLESAPDVGDVLPDFLCPDDAGRLVSLSTFLAKGPIVVSFNRGHWCPYCKLELRELARVRGTVAALGADIVSIVPETGGLPGRLARENGLSFPVLVDVDLSYALSLGLATPPGPELQRLYRKAGIDLDRFQGNDFWMLPSPATFVVDRDGRIVARYVDPDFRRRMPIEDIVQALERLR